MLVRIFHIKQFCKNLKYLQKTYFHIIPAYIPFHKNINNLSYKHLCDVITFRSLRKNIKYFSSIKKIKVKAIATKKDIKICRETFSPTI